MGTKSIARYQIKHKVEYIIWAETEAARIEGRVAGQVSDDLYQFFKALEKADYLDPDQRVNFWQRRFDEVYINGHDWSIYNRANAIIEAKKQWSSGESVTVWSCNGHKVTVDEYGYDGGGLLALSYHNGQPGKVAGFDCGYVDRRERCWKFNLSRVEYERWVAKARRLV